MPCRRAARSPSFLAGHPAVIPSLFFLSGLCALIYEVVWTRELGLLFGHTVYAVSTVLSAFMGGLALGSYLIGRRIERWRNPLRVYAYLEFGIAASALLFPVTVAVARPGYGWLYERAADHFWLFNVTRFALAALLLMVPTTMMGATLPALSARYGEERGAGSAVGRLYAVNTLGATIGCFVAGFVLVERLGVIEAQVAAAALNILVGLVALAMARPARPGQGTEHDAPSTLGTKHQARSTKHDHALGTKHQARSTKHDHALGTKYQARSTKHYQPLIPLFVVAVSGFTALAYEVVWTRALVFFVGTTTYAFTSMLGIFLVALALGSYVSAKLDARIRDAASALAVTQLLIAPLAATSILAVARLAPAIDALVVPETSWAALVVASLAKATTAIFLPAMLLGTVFPLAIRLSERGGGPMGRRVARIYATNTLGAILGSALAGFVLIPWLGMQGTLTIGASLNAALAGLLALAMRRAGLAGIAAGVCLGIWFGRGAPHAVLHTTEGSEAILYYAEGPTATVSVVREVGGSKTLYIDRVPVAGTDPIMLTDQKSLAHVPMLLHRDPKRVLTVGFGSGGASWSFATHDRLARIDCVEIDPGVFGAAEHLTESNHRVWTDPRFRLILEDARTYLAHSREQYDIISTDCTDLRYKSNANLYTTDYFALCRRRLNPGGIVVVWMPLGGLSEDVFRLALRTFSTIFPHATLWYMSNYPTHYALLVATAEPLRIDRARLLARLGEPNVRADLAEIRLEEPAKILSGLLLDEHAYTRFVGPGPVNRDRYPVLEFVAPRRAWRFALSRNLAALAARRSDVRPLLTPGPDETRLDEALARTARAAPAILAGHVIYQRQTFEYEAAIQEYRRAARADPTDATIPGLIASAQATRQIWIGEYERRVAAGTASPADRATLGELYADAGRIADATRELETAVAAEPTRAGARRRLGLLLAAEGRTAEALGQYERALAIAPESPEVHNDVGLLYLARGEVPRARSAFREAVRLDPGSAAAWHNLGLARVRLGDPQGAAAAYREAIRLDERMIEAQGNLAALYASIGRRAEAIALLEHLLAVEPTAGAARDLLTRLRAAVPP